MKNLFVFLLLFVGVFLFNVPKEWECSSTSQLAYLLLISGCLGSSLIYKKNKWLGALAGLCVLGTFKTLLLGQASKFYIFKHYLTGAMLFVSYYAVRELRFKEDILKWLLFPAWVNIAVVYIQRYSPDILWFLSSDDKITGLIGNAGFTACFLGMSMPLFIRYCKFGIPFLLYGIIICDGTVGLVAGVASGLLYMYFVNKRIFKVLAVSLVIFSSVYIPKFAVNKVEEVKTRLATYAFTLEGIRHHPFIGWGLGSYVSTFARIPPEDTKRCGTQVQFEGLVNNHPHNELLFGWWNFGVFFPILCLGYMTGLFRKLTKDKALSFSIIMAGVVCLLGQIMTPPSWLVLFTGMSVYENL